jgi:hypothetical protein
VSPRVSLRTHAGTCQGAAGRSDGEASSGNAQIVVSTRCSTTSAASRARRVSYLDRSIYPSTATIANPWGAPQWTSGYGARAWASGVPCAARRETSLGRPSDAAAIAKCRPCDRARRALVARSTDGANGVAMVRRVWSRWASCCTVSGCARGGYVFRSAADPTAARTASSAPPWRRHVRRGLSCSPVPPHRPRAPRIDASVRTRKLSLPKERRDAKHTQRNSGGKSLPKERRDAKDTQRNSGGLLLAPARRARRYRRQLRPPRGAHPSPCATTFPCDCIALRTSFDELCIQPVACSAGVV